MIAINDKLPEATLLRLGDAGPENVELRSVATGKAVIFGVPGAYTGVCSTQHVPSFINQMDELREKGVEAVICVSVNDPFVMDAWAKDTGAAEAGIQMLADPEGALIRSLGLDFTAPPAGLIGRAKRFAMVVEGGVIAALNVEENPGQCAVSGGDAIAQLL